MKVLKKITCIILILLIIPLSNTISLAATKLTKDIANIIEEYYKWTESDDCKKDKNGQVNKTAAANKLIELCKSDSNKLNALYANYTEKQLQKYGGAYGSNLGWPGGSSDNIICQSISLAINNVKNGVTNIDTNNSEEEKTKAKDKIKKKYQVVVKAGDSVTQTQLKEVDKLIKNYVTKYGQLSNEKGEADIIEWAKVVSEKLKQLGSKEETAYEQYTGENQQRQENNGDTTTSRPSTGVLGESNPTSTHTPDEVISEAGDFISAGQKEGTKIDGKVLKEASDTLYNILLVIGIFLAVAIGMYLGIKFMLASAEDRAKVKESLIPYIAGCVVVFGAFVIWKLAVTLLSNLA